MEKITDKFNYQNALLRQIGRAFTWHSNVCGKILTYLDIYMYMYIHLAEFRWFFEAQDTGKAAAIQSHQTL